ncbi:MULTISPECIES: beta-1,6-N-acetylglucosaminyltransferase [Coprobacillaceae]|uniref:beta-1,6-N-acetylglucosaminyltransferase n=1 Tax=Coprobacillaceae TaxID=2810280 RepID=UPI000E491775|nr:MULTISPECIES: beta-1,6-N-acetylglucosaminyltransferase [Coprobacillaceae]RHM59397.1 hypothetical protein DWZ53_09455 [Coprobacillus sp. AF33-1AC]RHS91756.1 hypothetical protein DW911_09745 [Erysipelatoclostridium sp. AM42-17]
MKIAFLMLAHKSPQQINKLLECLQDSDIDVYIHLDKKSNIKKDIQVYPNIIYVDDADRVDIKWGSVSMVNATIQLIKTMVNSKKVYDYVYLISGQDFIIKDIQELKSFLDNNKGQNFIEILDETNSNYYKYRKRVEVYYPQWMISRNKLIILLKFAYIIITGGMTKVFFKRKQNYNLPFAFGSQWWTLQYNAVLEMYTIISKHPEYVNYYKNSLVPDESFFQTIFMMTSFNNKSSHHSLTYTNWEGQVNHPKTLTKEDIIILENEKNKYLGRKFDENVDNSIIDYFYKKLRIKRGD